ncbi:MAG: hypothetical protein KAI66_11475 [Lentisphaeria bacterium]|nr:hypothetical protein [Lentisphaeria bacterium]
MFRKTFLLDRMPRASYLLATADNTAKIWLNGTEIGGSDSWTSTSAFDVRDYLVKGRNTIGVECRNVDGPAGLLLELSLFDNHGDRLVIASDSTWKQCGGNPPGWSKPAFDDESWGSARVLGAIGQEPWGERVEPNYALTQRLVDVIRSEHPVVAGCQRRMGEFDIPYSLHLGHGAVGILKSGEDCVAAAGSNGTADRILVLALNPDRTGEGTATAFRANPFRRLLTQGVLWLSGESESAISSRFAAAASASAPRGQTVPHSIGRRLGKDLFPVAMQLSPLPCDYDIRHARYFYKTATRARLRAIVDDMIEHGATSLYLSPPVSLQGKFGDTVNYAQSRGMTVTFNAGTHSELFGRDKPPEICVYSDTYEPSVREKYLATRKSWQGIPGLSHVFPYQDEPFHWGQKSFGYNRDVKSEFRKRYHYELPADLDSIREDPKSWLDVINFRSDFFPDGWRRVYKTIKSIDPDINVILTHDSHNTFGGGVGHQTIIAIDDVFHWGGDFADTFVFDIYPYMMIDFRYGKYKELPKPRMAQTHFAMAQMRNLTRSYGKTLGFWFGTYNDTWFKQFMNKSRRAAYWAENEMCFTAVANDADFLCAGFNVPQDQKHWDTLGRGLGVIHKVGPRLLATRRVKSRAAFLFPRTQYVQMQTEYWSVAQSFELFQRAFGELDVIHEEQITDSTMNGYEMLVLCDIELLPEKVAESVCRFVREGGVVIADQVPSLGRFRKPMTALHGLFGVEPLEPDQDGDGGRKGGQDAVVRGRAFQRDFEFPAVRIRPCRPGGGQVLMRTSEGAPALIRNKTGRGSAYLLGFCLKETYFSTWAHDDVKGRAQLRALLSSMTNAAGVVSHVHSSNPDIETAIRANVKEAFLLVISHEAETEDTVVRIRDLPFAIGRVRDVETGRDIPFEKRGEEIRVHVTVDPVTKTRLLELARDPFRATSMGEK